MRVKSPNKFRFPLPRFRFFVFRLKVSSEVFVKSLLTNTLEMVDCIAWFSHLINWNFIVFVKINWGIFVSPMLSTQGNLKHSSESQRVTLWRIWWKECSTTQVFCFRCSFTAETTAFASQSHFSSTFFFFSWVKFAELHSWETEFVIISVRQLAMSRVTMNFF